MILLYLNADHIFASQSRYSWTPIWRRRKSSEHTSSFITHHSGVTLLTQQVFKFSRDPESGIISFWFHQVQHSPSTPENPGQTLHWYMYDFRTCPWTYSVYFWQSSFSQPNTAIPSSSSQPLVPVGSNLEEIRLKQVNNLSFCWPIPLLFLFPSAILTLSSFQAQESLNNSLFSFQIGDTS